MEQDICERRHIYIIGSYINACSIYRSIKAIGCTHPVTMLDTTISDGKCLADIVCADACIIKRKLSDKEDLFALIEDSSDETVEKYVLFTDETYMDAIRDAISAGTLKSTIAYTGSSTGNEKIFDRFLFYQFIDQLDTLETKTPRTMDGSVDPFAQFGSTFVVRLRRSWHSGVVLPSITIVNEEQQFAETLARFRNAGLTEDDWCFQELLSISDQHNISVCGWHDDKAYRYLVTRKVLQHPPKTGNGDVVETIADFPQGLIETTRIILTAMRYQGPFEMEFVFDKHTNCYKIIELNPRFWMQHGLFEELTNHYLIRRALREKTDDRAISAKSAPHHYWINANRFWYRLCKGQFSVLRYLNQGSCYPGLTDSLRWMPYYREYTRKQRG